MVYQLSLLDKSPIEEGLSAHQALQNTVATAQAAELSGFTRFWVAEHHHTSNFASSAPEVLVAYLLAATKTIRIGSGGVMLQHYSPYKVAEVFDVLASLAPGRVDIGIGKTPGGLPAATAALQAELSKESRLSFLEKVELLSQLLGGDELTSGRFQGIAATPKAEQKAQGYLLGASVGSAELAAKLGWNLSYAGHLNGNDQNLIDTFAAYNKATHGKVPLFALAVVVAKTEQEAKERAENIVIYKVHFPDKSSFSLPTYEAADEFGRQSGKPDYEIEKHKTHVIAGTASSVHQDLLALHHKYGIQEFMLEFPGSTFEERIIAIESIAAARQSMWHI